MGKYKDLYTPRKCSYTNRLITADDHASVQFAICRVDAEGRMIKDKSQNITFAVCGFVRSKAQSDSAVNVLATDAGLLKNVIKRLVSYFRDINHGSRSLKNGIFDKQEPMSM